MSPGSDRRQSLPIAFIDDAHTFGGAQVAMGWAIRVILRNTSERIVCVCPARTRRAIQEIAGEDSRLEFLECPAALPLNVVSFIARLPPFFRILSRLRRRGIRAWWLNLSGIEFCLAPLLVLRGLGETPVAWLHNTERFTFFTKRSSWVRRKVSSLRDAVADRWLFGMHGAIITPSRSSAAEMQSRIVGSRRPRGGHLYYPTIRADVETSSISHSDGERPKDSGMDLWMIGRVDCGHKNNLVALDTMKILIERGNDVRLTVVGDGPDLGELKAKTTSLGLTDAVRFLGWRDNPWQTVSKDAMVFIPSLYESMSIVAREAMIRGIRLTASTIPVFREWIPHRLIAEDFRPESFAEKLLYVQSLEEEDLLKMYAAALARFSDEVFAESFMAYMDGTGQNVAGVGPAASVFYR